jgi:hypothetical protein
MSKDNYYLKKVGAYLRDVHDSYGIEGANITLHHFRDKHKVTTQVGSVLIRDGIIIPITHVHGKGFRGYRWNSRYTLNKELVSYVVNEARAMHNETRKNINKKQTSAFFPIGDDKPKLLIRTAKQVFDDAKAEIEQIQRHEENIENIKGQITELREQIERSFEPIDDWKMEVLKQGSGIAKLEKMANNHSERPQIGIIRRFWRWLW